MYQRHALFSLSLSAMIAGCAESPSGPVDGTSGADDRLVPTVPSARDVTITDFIEIDDLDGLGSRRDDANLCADGVSASTACPSPGSPSDNPNFPGPEPTSPATPGLPEDYIDWADLGAGSPFFLSDQSDANDDIFRSGSCLGIGNAPGKANLHDIGVAANDTWLYLLSERVSVQGQEEHHYLFTQLVPHFEFTSSCPDGTWLWDMTPGDVRVTLRFQSTSGLPTGDAVVEQWAGAGVGLTAESVLRSSDWEVPDPAMFPPPMQPAYLSFNVAPGTKTPDADTETWLDGTPLQTSQISEMAVDVARVFGQGCGLNRTMSVVTTSSGSGNDRDALKDFLAPIQLTSATMSASLTVTPSCGRSFDYRVDVERSGAVALPSSDLDVAITYDCGSGPMTVHDTDGVGTIQVSGANTATCSVSATVTGSGEFAFCAASDVDTVTVYAPLGVTADLSQAGCGAPWAWDATPRGGLAPFGYEWSFDGASPVSAVTKSGTGTLPGGVAPASIAGQVTLTDARGCEAVSSDSLRALHELSLSVVPTGGDGECEEGDLSFSATIQGGSGEYGLMWRTHDDAHLDAGCASRTSASEADASLALACSFGLGDAACARGDVDLTVRDAACGATGPMGVAATRVSSTSVAPTR